MINHIFKYFLFVTIFVVGLIGAHFQAGAFNDPPRDFLFGNSFDDHQETKLKKNGNIPVSLSGFLYIIWDKDGAIDPVSGFPIARHPRGPSKGEECGVDVDCVAGWLIDGVPARAKLLYKDGVNILDHPFWIVNREDMIQPGSYTHFHWITKASNDPRAGDVENECNKTSASKLEAAPSAVDKYCDGWFIELRAVKNFAFDHLGEVVPVRAGIDNATHLNLVTDYKEISIITPTR